jgi:uncharacterized protein (DUF2336 family)
MEYEEARKLAASDNPNDRRTLAADRGSQPEILYFLAGDGDASVRKTVAGNPATPRQGDLILAKDGEVAVREGLARKLDRLIPSLADNHHQKIRELTLELVGLLARDEAVRVRRIVAETLQDKSQAPREVILHLARDLEIQVAGPVLRNSPILADNDLIDIISSKPIKGALGAIAARRGIGEALSARLVEAAREGAVSSRDPGAIAALLANPTAQIREDTLDLILDEAPRQPAWHRPLVDRPALSQAALKRLAAFVSTSLLAMLQSRGDLDQETAQAIAKTVRKRMEEEGEAHDGAPKGEEAMGAAIAAGRRDAVMAALARDSGVPSATVDRILGSRSAKAVTALAWRAKLPMRQALQLQLRLAGIAPRQALNPKDGTDYPMTPSEMDWQLELFGVE